MKKTVKILSIICAALMILSLCACGAANGEKDAETSEKSTEFESNQEELTEIERDKKVLKNAGFSPFWTYTDRETLSGYEEGMGFEKGSLVARLEAFRPGYDIVIAYYFVSTDFAERYAQNGDGVARGTALIYGDRLNWISHL